MSPDPVGRKLQRLNEVRYITVDKDAPATVKASVLALPFTSGAFDLVLCSHVLEHITDDLGAVKELLRVTTSIGTILIMVPVNASYDQTYEDSSVAGATARARAQAFGQHDHVRIYGRDFPKRLQSTGAMVTAVRASDMHDSEEIRRYALIAEDQIFVCRPALGG